MENFNPLVSVIINCYNGEKYLREAIDSVIAQTYTNWEIIFWDNQSTDSSAEIVKSYNDDRIKYYYAPKHTPLGEARNMAVDKANGEYINFLDADDAFLSNKLSVQIRLLEKGISEVIISKYLIKIEDKGKVNKSLLAYFVKNKNYSPKGNSFYADQLKGNKVAFSTVLFNKNLYRKVGGVDSSFKQNEDYDILLKCALNTIVKSTENPQAIYRIHANNTTNSIWSLGLYENRKIFNQLPKDKNVVKTIKRNETTIGFYMIIKDKKIYAGIRHIYIFGSVNHLITMMIQKIYRATFLYFYHKNEKYYS